MHIFKIMNNNLFFEAINKNVNPLFIENKTIDRNEQRFKNPMYRLKKSHECTNEKMH